MRRALNRKFQGWKNLEDYQDFHSKMDPLSLTWQGRVISALQEIIVRILDSARPLKPRIKGWQHELHQLWRMPFHEAFLVRFFYVLSYIIFLASEAISFEMGLKVIHLPLWFLFSAFAILMLALIWAFPGSIVFEKITIV